MSQIIGVFVAWPYANGELHLGHAAGAYLPPDIFARYHRLKGNKVLMVSGTDSHGTPITVRAHKEGTTPRTIFERYHQQFMQNWFDLGVSYNLYTHTDTKNHHTVAQEIFTKLYEKGDVFLGAERQLFDEQKQIFLPDRYVEGTCPFCGFNAARGDQCDNCGRTFDAVDLLNPRSTISGSTPIIRNSEQFFLRLTAYRERLITYIDAQKHWRPTVSNYILSWLKEGLVDRPITRDIDWGINVPLEQWHNKVMYVWFEAVIGYLSASKEWANNQASPNEWIKWWNDKDAKSYYFIGKDNVPFHAIIWPSILMGYDINLLLPYDVAANQFLNFKGEQFSKSRGVGVSLSSMLENYNPDTIRYYLTAVAPETKDTSFTWGGFVSRNNKELVAAWGNLVNRVFSFTHTRYENKVPVPQNLDEADRTLLQEIEKGFNTVGLLYESVKLREALSESMRLVREVNKYLNTKEPWKVIKTDPLTAATSIFVSLRAIDSLKTLLSPVLPHSCELLHGFFNYSEHLFGDQNIVEYSEGEQVHQALIYTPTQAELLGINMWKPSELQPGTILKQAHPLFEIIQMEVDEDEENEVETY